MIKKTFYKLLTILLFNILFVVTLLLVYRRIQEDPIDVDFSAIHFGYFTLSIVFFFLFYFAQSIAWVYLLSRENLKFGFKLILSFYASHAFKYLPSSVFTFSARVYYAKKQGVTYKDSIKAVFLESLFVIGTGTLAFALYYEPIIFFIVIASALSVYFIGKTFYNSVQISIVKKILALVYSYSFWDLAILTALHGFSWIMAAASLQLFNISVTGESLPFMELIAFKGLSYSASILAVFSPGGIGVRELVLSYSSIGATVYIGWRVINVIFDVVVSAVAIVLIFINNRVRKQ